LSTRTIALSILVSSSIKFWGEIPVSIASDAMK